MKRNDWNPTWVELFINANYLERRELYRKIKDKASVFRGVVLDIGCGTKPYKNLFVNSISYIGLEIYGGGGTADVFYDGKIFPFEDGEFDGIVSFQAIYQADEIEKIVMEMNRVLKIDADVLISVPFIWFDGGKSSELRFSDRYTKLLFEKYGFELISKDKTNANLSAIAQLLNSYIYENIAKIKIRYIRFILKLITTPVFNTIGLVSLYLLPKTNNLYIGSLIYLKKIKNLKN